MTCVSFRWISRPGEEKTGLGSKLLPQNRQRDVPFCRAEDHHRRGSWLICRHDMAGGEYHLCDLIYFNMTFSTCVHHYTVSTLLFNVITVITVLQCQSRIRLLGYIYNSARGLSKRPDNHLLIYKDALYISLLLLWLAHTSSKSRHKDTHFSFEL